jgi:SAM-dependent methyltransferase
VSAQARAVSRASTPAESHRAWRALLEAATRPYREAGGYAWRFARGKLGGDPVFRHVLEQGLIAPYARVLDIGCGQGLLASLLRAAGDAARHGRWPADWAPAPLDARVTGIELMPHDVERAQTALGGAATFVCGDMRTLNFPAADTVVLFDALHYIPPHDQDAVLDRARHALRKGGSLLLRVNDAGARRRFALGLWIDRVTMLLRGGGFAPLAGRSVEAWSATLDRLGFDVRAYPMSGRPPFANQLLVARLAPGAARAPETR